MSNSRAFFPLLITVCLLSTRTMAGLDDGLVLYYSFTSNLVGTVIDESGNGNTGTVRGATRTNTIRGTGYSFDGINDEILVPNSPSLNPTKELSVSAWFRCAGPGIHNGVILLKGTASRNTGQYALIYFPSYYPGVTGHFSFSLRTAMSGGWHDYYSTGILMTGVWYHVVGTYKSGALNLYVNGVPAFPTITTVTGPILPADGPLFVGSEHSFPNDDEYFKGQIDEVRAYNRVLSPAEVLALYEGRPSTDPAWITQIGFSNDPNGDQDVTEFLRNETIHIRVRDVDAEGGGSIQAYFTQPRSPFVTVKLTEGPDGAFRGSVPANRFRAGPVNVSIASFLGPKGSLWKTTQITIRPANAP